MEKHNVCKGECGGVSDEEGVCKSETCSRSGQPLEGCECGDGKHGGEREEVGSKE